MGLLDDLDNADNFSLRIGSVCSTCTIIEKLDEAEATKLTELLNNKEISSATIARVLTKNGYKILPENLGRHRRGDCRGARR